MEYTLEQLKAMAYDELAKIENAQRNLSQINLAIKEKIAEVKTETETPIPSRGA
jgi:hypothetical protein